MTDQEYAALLADLRKAICRIINSISEMPLCWADEAADAILSILPQTQEFVIKNAVEVRLLEMRKAGEIFTLGQVNDLVQAAASFDARSKAADNILRYEEE